MSDDNKPFHNPFGVLAHLRGATPPAPAEPPVSQKPSSAPRPVTTVKTVARAVVRMERSGRGGKEVTVIEHLDLSTGERERWLKQLKTALGVGGYLEGDAIVIQGDQRTRIEKPLNALGVKQVKVGN